VRNGFVRRYPQTRIILSHAGGFVPYPGHVLFGSDWPYAPETAVDYFTAQLDGYAPLDAGGHAAIDRRNAEALFSAFADQEAA
jgi:predicted TIM-barrel fold metal-dependent hydrolase